MAMLNHQRVSNCWTPNPALVSVALNMSILTNAMEIPYEDHETTATKTCRCELVQKQGTKTLIWLKNSCPKFTWQFR